MVYTVGRVRYPNQAHMLSSPESCNTNPFLRRIYQAAAVQAYLAHSYCRDAYNTSAQLHPFVLHPLFGLYTLLFSLWVNENGQVDLGRMVSIMTTSIPWIVSIYVVQLLLMYTFTVLG